MSFWEERRGKKIRKETQEQIKEQKEILEEAKTEASSKNNIIAFLSLKTQIRKMLPYILVSGALGYIEYRLIGLIYTVISIAVYVPMIFVYTKSLQSHSGNTLMVSDISNGFTDMDTYLIPDELWRLIHFDFPPMPSIIRYNGRTTYVAYSVKKIPGTDIFYSVKLALAHTDQGAYMLGRGAMDRLQTLVYNMAEEISELKNLKNLQAKMEGIREKETAFHMMSKYKANPLDLANEIKKHENNIRRLVDENKDIIIPPDHKSEEEENEKDD